jgi:hypothetical protein
MVMLCNDPARLDRLLEALEERPLAQPERLEPMRHKGGRDLRRSVAYREAQAAMLSLTA